MESRRRRSTGDSEGDGSQDVTERTNECARHCGQKATRGREKEWMTEQAAGTVEAKMSLLKERNGSGCADDATMSAECVGKEGRKGGKTVVWS